MKKYILYILILVVLIGIPGLTSTSRVSAQTQPSTKIQSAADPYYHLLAPLPCPSGSTGCDVDNQGNNQFSTFDPRTSGGNTKLSLYLNLMIKIFIGICGVLAVIMILWGGIEYMGSELISSKEAGKERIRDAILGLLLALGSWAILNQINPNLLNSDVNMNIASVTSGTLDDTPQTPTLVNGKYMYGGYESGTLLLKDFPNNSYPTLPTGVSVCASNGQCGNAAQCTTVGQANCTSTFGLNTVLVNSLASGCAAVSGGTPCDITITAGTEWWLHTSGTEHQVGNSVVDIRATSDLNNYIADSPNFPTGQTIEKNGACYNAEGAGSNSANTGAHWHVYPPTSSGGC